MAPRIASIAAVTLFAITWILYLVFAGFDFCHLTPDLNDDVLHLRLIDLVAETIAAGGDPTDPWLSTITEGFPLFHHYQHLPHLVLGALRWLLGDTVSSLALLRGSQLLLLLAFPWSVARTTSRFADRSAGCFAGISAVLLATDGLYGLDLSSYGWNGVGLTTQLWGAVLLGPTWVVTRDAIHGRRRLAAAVVLMALLILTHALLAWVAALTTVVWCFEPRGPWPLRRLVRRLRRDRARGGWRITTDLRARLIRTGVIIGAASAATSYFLVPFFLDRHVMNRSVWEATHKYDAYGLVWTVRALTSGDLLDGSRQLRWPVLTVLLAVGLVLFVLPRTWRVPFSRARRALVLLFGFWLLLFFGRAFWGGLVALLPLSNDLHFHRLIVPVQLVALVLIGSTSATLWRLAFARFGSRSARALIIAVTAAVFAQPALERARTFTVRHQWLRQTRAAIARDQGQLDALLGRLRELPPARAYAGRAPNWGGRYRLGAVPVYARLTAEGIDNLGYLYHALSLNADVEGYLDETRPAQFALFNVGYFVAPSWKQPPVFARRIAEAGDHSLYAIESGGLFDLVRAAGSFAGNRADWFDGTRRWLASEAVEAKLHPVFIIADEIPVGAWPITELSFATSVAPRLGWTSNETVEPGRMAVTVHVEEPCYLLAKATFHPNWRVTVDGAPREAVMLAPAFLGVALSPGQHQVELRYQPRPLRTGLRWLGALFLLVFCVASWSQGRRVLF